ncbi:MAG TPA: alpha/beta fold hydrolase, partial [Candidatus Bathyarchaeia archaeon]|nr:alpha/beta fold hydrolase [Candidatus Bathyarchaeia archaeon]
MRRINLVVTCAALLTSGEYCSAAAPQQAGTVGKTAGAPQHASLEGDWSGALQVGEAQLHLVLHLKKNAQGEWQVTLDSLDQAVYGMEASNVKRGQDTLAFELPSVGAHFQGKILPDSKAIRGLWEQGGTGLPLLFEKRAAGAERFAGKAVSKAEGTWQGAIETDNMRMRLQLHITHDDKGKLLASVDSLDQEIQGIPASNVTERAGEVKFELSAFGAQYLGTLNATKNEIAGYWSQNGNDEKLDFRRSDQILELRRPQNPAKPYPYKEEEISFAAADGKATLAGTLTLPPGAGPFPAAILLGGSGPVDRDATVAGHKPFLVLADALTRKGVAILRYDKRGIAQSKGDYAQATMQDFTLDAQAALDYMKSRKEVDAKRLGVIGHSEGGILASLVATRSQDMHWLVLLATPATTGENMLLRQSELIARAGGLPEEQITHSLEFDRKAYAAVREEKNPAALEKRLDALVQQSGLGEAMPPAAVRAQIRFMTSPWFRQFLDFDPEPALEKLQCPVLALSGDRDLQVDSTENVPLLRKASETSENKD